MRLRNLDVFFRPTAQAEQFGFLQRAHDLRRRAQDHRSGWGHKALRYEGVGAHDAMVTDDSTIENRRPHADQALVANRAGVDDGAVADRRILAHFHAIIVGQMHHGQILHIAALTDLDRMDVTAQYGAIPHTAQWTEGDVADDRGIRCHKRRLGYVRFLAQVPRQPLLDIHPRRLQLVCLTPSFAWTFLRPARHPDEKDHHAHYPDRNGRGESAEDKQVIDEIGHANFQRQTAKVWKGFT